MGQVVEHKDGKYLCHINLMIKYLLKAIDETLEECTMMCVSRITVLLLTAPGINITQLDASRLSKRMLNINSTVVFSAFIKHSVGYSQFELLILPDFLKYLERNFDTELLSLLAEIVSEKSPLCKTGIALNTWSLYPVVLKQKSTLKSLANIVNDLNVDGIEDDEEIDTFLVVALCYPHIVNVDEALLCKKSVNIIEKCLQLVKTGKSKHQKKLFYI
jgi:U3 small nucleolar RNA-associated protein 20